MMIGKIQRVPLRSVWRHEAHDFTSWLEKNIDVLNDALNLNLDNVEREQAAGDFSVDLLAEETGYGPVIIENQLERSDHDHLGKLITYLAAFDAKAAIWIVAHPRPEHVAAIGWLNESSPADFFLVKMEAITIDESPPAPLLTLITGPSAEARQVGATKKEWAERDHLRYAFWEQLLDQARARQPLFADVSPSNSNYRQVNAGLRGVTYVYAVRQNDGRVELYIDRLSREENKALFDKLFENRQAIDAAYGGELNWQRRDGNQVSTIIQHLPAGGYKSDKEQWPGIQEGMIDAMTRLEKAFQPYLQELS